MPLPSSPATGLSPVHAGIGKQLSVGDQLFDVGALRMLSAPEQPRITPKAMAVLLELASQPRRPLTRDELLDRVWTDTFPTPDVLTQAIKELRRVLGDDLKAPRYIETIPKVGYRLIVDAELRDGGSVPLPLAEPLGTDADPHSPRRRIWPWLLALAVALVGGAALALLLPARAPLGGERFEVDVGEQRVITATLGAERFPHLSPNGAQVAFSRIDADSGRSRIYVQDVAGTRTLELTAAATAGTNDLYPVFSPDGSTIAFLRIEDDHCRFVAVPVLGGTPRVLGDCGSPSMIGYFSWTPDGQGLIGALAASEGGVPYLGTLTLADGKVTPLVYERAATDHDLDPKYSPDGRWIAFRRNLRPYSDLYLMPAGGGALRKLTAHSTRISGFDWSPDSSMIVLSSNQGGSQGLYAIDVASTRIVPLDVAPAEFPSFAVATPDLVYQLRRVRRGMVALELDRTVERSRQIASSTGSDRYPALSPDGRRVAFVSDRGGSEQVWVHDFDSGETYALTELSGASVIKPVWNGNGTRIAATVRRDDGGELIEIDLDSRRQRSLSKPGEDVRYAAYDAHGGGWLAVVGGGAGHANVLERIVETNRPDAPLERRPLFEGVIYAQADPGSGAIYFTRQDSAGLFRLDRPGAEPVQLAPEFPIERAAAWELVGGRIWYLAFNAVSPGKPELRAVDVRGRSRIDPHPLIDFEQDGELHYLNSGLSLDPYLAVTPDGRRAIVCAAVADDTDVGMVRITRRGQDLAPSDGSRKSGAASMR